MKTPAKPSRSTIAVLTALLVASAASAAPVVTSGSDAGPGSLRQAVQDAAPGDVITFNLSGTNTISLTSGEIILGKNLTISGPGAALLTIRRESTAPAFRIFQITPGRTVRVEGLTISNGVVQNGRGGGILNDQANLTLDRCVISGNSITGAGNGGGLSNQALSGSATLTIINSTVSGNSSGQYAGGGLSNHYGGLVRIMNSTFSANSATYGGGVANDDGETEAINSTFTGNSATVVGGAISIPNRGIVRVRNSTFWGNTAPDGGSAIDARGSGWPSRQLIIANCVFKKGGPAPNIYDSELTPEVDSYGYNISDDDGSGFLTVSTDQINTDPLLGPLRDNGGYTLTHAPLAGSPAIDRGKNFGFDVNGALILTDQRGQVRPRRYNPAIPTPLGGDGSDIGAVEVSTSTPEGAQKL